MRNFSAVTRIPVGEAPKEYELLKGESRLHKGGGRERSHVAIS